MRISAPRALVAVFAASASLLAGTSAAGAADAPHLTCSGGPVAAGRYASLTVTGTCLFPSSGVVEILGNLTVAEGGALFANYPALGPDQPEGDATVVVGGEVLVGKGAALLLGCSPHVGCVNTTNDRIGGGIRGRDALGVILHSSAIHGGVSISGGGGGVTCTPSGVFAALGQPVYSDLEDNAIWGNVSVSGLETCWFGALRNQVHGNFSYHGNTYADPDAGEVLQNTIWGNLSCEDNLPAVQFGDSGASPNLVRGRASGECVFPISERFA